MLKKACLFQNTGVQKADILYTRGGQLIWVGGHFEKATFSGGP